MTSSKTREPKLRMITVVPQLSKCLQIEAVRGGGGGGIKLIKGFEFEQTNKQDPCVYCCSQNGSS